MAILGLVVAYYITGRLGLLLAIPPGYATAVWPPSGIALAGVLIFGYRVWPGVALGSFLVNVGTSFDGATAAAFLRSIGIAAGIGLGAALQACAGAFLVRRFVGFPTALDEADDVMRFMILGGPVGCLVNATWSVTTLAVTGTALWSDYPFNWWTWWVGDTIGVVTVTPLILIVAAPPREVWRARRVSVGLPLLVAIIAAVVVFVKASAWEREGVRFDFERRSAALADTVQKGLDGYLEVIYSIEGFYAGTVETSRHGFRAFVNRPLSRHPGIKALEWIPRVPASQRGAYERGARRDGYPAYQIIERDARGQNVPAGQRDEYFPVYFVEPYLGNEAALGFDLASDPIRRQVLFRARDLGEAVATSRITLVQETGKSFGVLLALPIYSRGLPTPSVELRRQNLAGFALLVLRMNDFLRSSLTDRALRGIELRLYDDNGRPGEDLLWSSAKPAADGSGRLDEGLQRPAGSLSWRTSFGVAGRQWSVRVFPGPGYLGLHRSWQSWTLLALALLFAGVLGALLLIVTGRTLKTEALAIENRALYERYRSVFDGVPVGLYRTSLTGQYLDVNPTFLRMLGYPDRETLMSGNASNLYVDPEVGKRWMTLLESANVVTDFESQLRRRDGAAIWVRAGARVVRNPAGQSLYIDGAMIDITERKRTEHVLEQSEARKSAILRGALDCIITIDHTGRILEFNPAAEATFGHRRGDVLGHELGDLIIPPGLRDHHRRGLAHYLATGESAILDKRIEITALRATGEEFPVELTVIRDPSSNPPIFTGFARDITERKRADNEIRALNKELDDRVRQRTAQLKAANEELEAFVYGAAHDLRTPLITIAGLSRMLIEDHASSLPDEARRHLQTVDHTAQGMSTLMSDLLAFSRLGRQPIKTQPVAPADVARQALAELGGSLTGRQATVTIDELPLCTADPVLLKQVLLNLLSNALKFTRNCEGAVIEVGWRKDLDDRAQCTYFVKDSGVGFDVRYADKLFGVFQRLHQADEYEGTGLGLAIVQRIISRHGGRVWAEGEPGKGATFYFTLARNGAA